MLLWTVQGDERNNGIESVADYTGLTDFLGYRPLFCSKLEPKSLEESWFNVFAAAPRCADRIEIYDVDDSLVIPLDSLRWGNEVLRNHHFGDATLFEDITSRANLICEWLIPSECVYKRKWTFKISDMMEGKYSSWPVSRQRRKTLAQHTQDCQAPVSRIAGSRDVDSGLWYRAMMRTGTFAIIWETVCGITSPAADISLKQLTDNESYTRAEQLLLQWSDAIDSLENKGFNVDNYARMKRCFLASLKECLAATTKTDTVKRKSQRESFARRGSAVAASLMLLSGNITTPAFAAECSFDPAPAFAGVVKQILGIEEAYADDTPIAQGNHDGVDWKITSDGVLVFGQEGTTQTFSGASTSYPWQSSSSSVLRVRFEGEVIAAPQMPRMFSYMTECVEFDLENFNLESAVDLSQLFYDCFKAKHITNFQARSGSLTTIYNMFDYCLALEEIDLSGLNTENVISLSSIFSHCSSLKTCDLSNFNTSKVTTMSNMFADCSSLVEVHLENFDTSNVTDFSQMFRACNNLTEIDLSSFNAISANYFSYMFQNCINLRSLDLSHFNITPHPSTWTSFASMFENCISLENLDMSSCRIEGFSRDMFHNCSSLTEINATFLGSDCEWAGTQHCQYMFAGCTNLTTIDMHSFQTSAYYLADYGHMFEDCSSLEYIDISHMDNFNWPMIFKNCRNLKTIVLPTQSYRSDNNTVNMLEAFSGCQALTSIDLSGLAVNNRPGETSSISSYLSEKDLFAQCGNLRSITLPDNLTLTDTYNNTMNIPTPPNDITTGKWIREDQAYGPYTPEEMYAEYNPATMYGTWVWEYDDSRTITRFDANGGYVANDTDEQGIEDIHDILLPTASRFGYIFNGWNSARNGSGTNYDAGSVYSPVSGTVTTLYAQWEKDTRVGYTMEIYEQKPTFDGYTKTRNIVMGPQDEPGETITVDPPEISGFKTPDSQSLTLEDNGTSVIAFYYDRTRYSVAFDGNNANSGVMENIECIGGRGYLLPTNQFQRDNYIFTGWNTTPDGTGTSVSATNYVSNLAEDGQEITLYAQWLELPLVPSESFGEYMVTLKAGEKVHFKDVPAYSRYEISEIEMPDWWQEDGNENTSGTVPPDTTIQTSVSNRYKSYGEAVIQVYKHIDAYNIKPGDFTFQLYDSSNQLISEVQNEEADTRQTIQTGENTIIANPHYLEAPVIFEPISFTEPGIYTYYIRETAGSNSSIYYNSGSITATVMVTDNGKGTLKTEVSYSGSNSNVFTNSVRAGGRLQIHKEIEDETDLSKEQEFEFTLSVMDANGEPISGELSGTRTFQENNFPPKEPDGYTETSKDAPVGGEGVATVIFDANGGYFGDEVARYNIVSKTTTMTEMDAPYISRTQNVSDTGTKTSDYGTYWGNTNIRGIGRENYGTSSAHVVSVPGAIALKVNFQVETQASGDYLVMWSGAHSSYTAQNNTDSAGYLTYNNNIRQWGARKNGTLFVPGDTMTFSFYSDGRNTGSYSKYGYYATIEGIASQETTGEYAVPTPPSSNYSFGGWYSDPSFSSSSRVNWDTFNGESNSITRLYAYWIKTSVSDYSTYVVKDGKTSFKLRGGEDISFWGLPPNTIYTLTENTPSGWSLVSSSRTNGTTPSSDFVLANFTNRYSFSGEWTPSARKVLSGFGAHLEDNQFEFVLEDESGSIVSRGTNDSEGNIQFEPIPYTQFNDGTTFNYTMREIAESQEGIEYDSNTYHISVTPHDNGQGGMTFDVEGPEDIVFNNRNTLMLLPLSGQDGQFFIIAGVGLGLVITASAWTAINRRREKNIQD